jgi:hypothetical protein
MGLIKGRKEQGRREMLNSINIAGSNNPLVEVEYRGKTCLLYKGNVLEDARGSVSCRYRNGRFNFAKYLGFL